MKIMNWIWIITAGLISGMPAAGQSAAIETQMSAAIKQSEQTMSAMAASIRQQLAIVTGAAAERSGEPAAAPDFFLTASAFPKQLQENDSFADCDPLPPMMVQALADDAARRNRVDANLVAAVMRQESGCRPCVVSPKGAIGLMQLMPETAAELGVRDAFDAGENVSGGARLLRSLLDRYAGNLNLALGAYNAGPARVDEFGSVPPFPETVHYVDSILESLGGFASPARP
jgi:soluble lytic murein transglycosylase-like protein